MAAAWAMGEESSDEEEEGVMQRIHERKLEKEGGDEDCTIM